MDLEDNLRRVVKTRYGTMPLYQAIARHWAQFGPRAYTNIGVPILIQQMQWSIDQCRREGISLPQVSRA